MSIGKWIVVVFILFAGFIGTLVTICVRQDLSLVSKDYYQQELAYQEQISRMNNTAGLQVRPRIDASREHIRITFDTLSTVAHGTVNLFCPSDATMDRTFKITQSDTQEFTLSGVKPGMYRVKLSWSMDGMDFYQEEIVNL